MEPGKRRRVAPEKGPFVVYPNKGTTCYIGVVLQILSAAGCTAYVPAELAEYLRTGRGNCAAIFNRVVKPHQQHLRGVHGDPHEAFLAIVDACAGLERRFGGSLSSVVHCLEHRGALDLPRTVPFTALVTAISERKGASTGKLIVDFFAEEKLTGVDCSTCRKQVDASKLNTLVLESIAEYWPVYINRGETNAKCSQPVTLTTGFKLPYGAVFRLLAVVVHLGKHKDSGHYVCYRKHGGRWWRVDDGTATEASEVELDSEPVRTGASLLLYRRE